MASEDSGFCEERPAVYEKEGVSVDFGYKKDPFRCYYDIEALPNLFTVTFWSGLSATLLFFGSAHYDDVSDEELAGAFSEYMSVPDHREAMGIKDGDDPVVNILRIREGDKESASVLRMNLARFIRCKPLTVDERHVGGDPNRFVEYVGWNSAGYDLPLMLMVAGTMDSVPRGCEFSPNDIRDLSDILIGYTGIPTKMPEEVATIVNARTKLHLDGADFRFRRNIAVWEDGHIDIAKMLRSTDDSTEQMFPPALKKMEAMMGLDIIADDAVGESSSSYVMDRERLLDFVKYNLHDVAATSAVGRTRDVVNRLYVRDIVRQMFPYTSARASSTGTLHKWTPPERDITEAQLTALSLVGPNRIRPVDYEAVSYEFPVPSGKGGAQAKVDLLDYMRDMEECMPPDVYDFFAHWRGKDTREWDDFRRIIRAQPITHVAMMNSPYYRKGGDGEWLPIDSYIRLSTGGAHQSVMAGLSDMSEAEIRAWVRSDAKPKKDLVVTLDLIDVIHADFTSYYPYLMTKMDAFKTSEDIDRYHEIYDRRVEIKSELSKHPDKSKWTQRERDMSDQQNGLKLQLNSATGKANTRHSYALLPLDNKILSMRLIGNMAIWCLSQRMAAAGGFPVSTNTDGIYCANITLEKAQEIIDGFVADYGILVEPEVVPRFINRDVSNRMEFIHMKKPNDVRGLLRSATKLVFDETEHGHSVNYPLAVGHAVVRYMSEYVDWLEMPYDRARMRKILEEIKESSDPIAWVHIYASNRKNRLLYGGELTQRVDRVALTKDGIELSQQSYRKVPIAKAYEVCKVIEANPDSAKFEDIGDELAKRGILIDGDILFARTETVAFAKKTKGKTRYDPDIITPLGLIADSPVGEFNDFADRWSALGANCLVYSSNGILHEVKDWSESKLSGYPYMPDSVSGETKNPRGVLLDSAEDLRTFDMSRLDMDAYLEWAESILRVWKVGGILGEDGRIETLVFDDDLTPRRLSAREKKKMDAIAALREAYSGLLN